MRNEVAKSSVGKQNSNLILRGIFTHINSSHDIIIN